MLCITVIYLGDDGNECLEHVHFEVGLRGELRKDHVGRRSEVYALGFDALILEKEFVFRYNPFIWAAYEMPQHYRLILESIW